MMPSSPGDRNDIGEGLQRRGLQNLQRVLLPRDGSPGVDRPVIVKRDRALETGGYRDDPVEADSGKRHETCRWIGAHDRCPTELAAAVAAP